LHEVPHSIPPLINLNTMAAPKTIRVGAVQAEPVWLDLQGSVKKTIDIIQKAASDGVQVLGFAEVSIPGYPWYGSLPAEPVQSID
jgi:predicted amidohydrolase